ncbi:hypothetical protein CHUAL_004744 [Chamberlinius hualienensis]
MKRRQAAKPLKKCVENTTRQRNARWLYEEEEILVDYVEKYYDVLFGVGSNRVSEESKQNLWEDIRKKLQDCNVDANREIASIKVKWIDLKSRTKKKIENMLLNGDLFGGDELEEYTLDYVEETLRKLVSPIEFKVIQMIGISQLIKNVTERESDQSFVVGNEYVPSDSKPSVSPNELAVLSTVGKELLCEIRGLKVQLQQFNDTFQEYVRVKKLKLGLNPNESLSSTGRFISSGQYNNCSSSENQGKQSSGCGIRK